jgi:hypothetical protein
VSQVLVAYFEVMDKEPTLGAAWGVALFLGAIGYLVSRWRRWAALPFLAAAMVFAWALLGELQDPFAGPAIRKEAGLAYVFQCRVAVVGAVVGPLIGLLRRRAA